VIVAKPLDMMQKKFGRLIIVSRAENSIHGKTRWDCICDCGNTLTVVGSDLKNGHTTSCGCWNIEKRTTHGMHDTRQYQIWADLKDRCDNPLNPRYKDYGGRGITYSESWKKFEGFWEDMSEGYDDGLTIDREDNDKSYYKENCRWATRSTQQHNQRKDGGSKFSFIGVDLRQSGKWAASIKNNNKKLWLGSFDTEQQAAKAYDDKSEEIYGDRPNKTARG
jgi:hypothetical protein